MKIKIILSISILIILFSCNAKKSIFGKYRSNFAEMGFFVTKIELNNDSTFNYENSGDLLHTELDGKYKIENKNLYLRFNKLKGETESELVKVNGKDTVVNFENFGKSHSYELRNENKIEYHLKYKITNQKLYAYNIVENRIAKKVNGYFTKRKYYLFGPKNYRKKRFLQKTEK